MREILERMLIRGRRADGGFGSDRAASCEDKRLLRDDVQALNEWIEMIGERLSGRPGITPHGLRHSAATSLRELGQTDRGITDLLDQRTIHATPLYSRAANMKRSNDRVMKALYDWKKPISDRPECV